MANIYEIPNVVTSIPDDSLIYAATPGGTNPDPYEDAVIEKSDLFEPLQSQITDNETDILDHETRITTLEDNSTKTSYLNYNSPFTFPQDENEHITYTTFRKMSGTPTVKIGTTLGGDDILTERLISDLYRVLDTVILPGSANRTLYVGVAGGTIQMITYSKLNVFDI